MRKEFVLGVLFFGGLWGIFEAVLGGALYRAEMAYASVILTAIGFSVLTVASVFFPQRGIATAIAACAMLYKFFNAPFFACHLFGILLIGLCYDLVFSVLKTNRRPLGAAAAVYVSYALFAVMMTYMFRYEYWTAGGLGKVLYHIGVSGSIAAACCAILVPLAFRFGHRLEQKSAKPFALRWRLVPGSVSFVTVGLWVFGLAVFLFV